MFAGGRYAVDAGTVKFKMDHLLSQIKFQAKLKAQYTGATKITVTGFKLSFATNKIKNAFHQCNKIDS